jgi:hypothetical protein
MASIATTATAMVHYVTPVAISIFITATQIARNKNVQVATAVTFSCVTAFYNCFFSDSLRVHTLNSQLDDAQKLMNAVTTKLGISEIKITNQTDAIQTINTLPSISSVFKGINFKSNEIYNHASDPVRKSMGQDAVIKLSLKDFENSGIQLSTLLDNLKTCHEKKVQFEEQKEKYENIAEKLDIRAENHHEETMVAQAKTDDAKDDVASAKDDVAAAKEQCKNDVVAAKEQCKNEAAAANKQCKTDLATAKDQCKEEVLAAKNKEVGCLKQLTDKTGTEATCKANLKNCEKNLNKCEHPGFLSTLFCWLN